MAFYFCQGRLGFIVSQLFIEHFKKNIQYGINFNVAGYPVMVGLYIKQDTLCGYFGSPPDISFQFEVDILCFFGKKLRTIVVIYQAVLKNVRKDFQQMRFTASKVARDPHALIKILLSQLVE